MDDPLPKFARIGEARAMSRQTLLSIIQDQNGRQRRQALKMVLPVAAFSLAGAALLMSGKVAVGLASLLFFGVGGALTVLMRLTTRDPTYGGGRLEARPVLWARLAMAAVMLASLAGVVAFVVSAEGLRQVEMAVLGAAWTLIVVLVLASFLRRGPVITVDAQGYFDRRASRAPIPWERIDSLYPTGIRNQVFYRLRIDDDRDLTLLTRMNRWVGAPGIAIGCAGLDVCDGDVVLAVHAWRPALLDGMLRGPFD